MRRGPCPLALVCVLVACGDRSLPPSGQLVLYVDTDAPVPSPPGEHPSNETAAPLFDRLRIELFDDRGRLETGAREFSVDTSQFAKGRVSIGVVLGPGASHPRARIRLFRGDRTIDDEPLAAMTLETVVSLPTPPSEGVLPVTAHLRVSDLGSPRGSIESPIAADLGAPPPSKVGTWPGALFGACVGAPAPTEACIQGGAFWFGDPQLRGRTEHNDVTEERLVSLRPYYLDLHEVTVAEFRAQWPALAAKGTRAPIAWTGTRDGDDAADWCTWIETPTGSTDPSGALPLNCVFWDTARAYCQALGKDLPTEAQFEFAASGLGREWGYPWGDEAPACDDAAFARAGFGPLSGYPGDCRAPSDPGWTLPAGSTRRDIVDAAVLRLPGSARVVDLGANLSEWALDQWSRADEAFWSQPKIFFDPVADVVSPSDGDRHPVRGGSWLLPANGTRAAYRLVSPPFDTPQRGAGFRCARPAHP